jgi:hypothetical protein
MQINAFQVSVTMTDEIIVQLKSGEPFGKLFQTGQVCRSIVCQTFESQNALRCLRYYMRTEGNGGGLAPEASRWQSANS